jgi:hypothetical protein
MVLICCSYRFAFCWSPPLSICLCVSPSVEVHGRRRQTNATRQPRAHRSHCELAAGDRRRGRHGRSASANSTTFCERVLLPSSRRLPLTLPSIRRCGCSFVECECGVDVGGGVARWCGPFAHRSESTPSHSDTPTADHGTPGAPTDGVHDPGGAAECGDVETQRTTTRATAPSSAALQCDHLQRGHAHITRVLRVRQCRLLGAAWCHPFTSRAQSTTRAGSEASTWSVALQHNNRAAGHARPPHSSHRILCACSSGSVSSEYLLLLMQRPRLSSDD